MKTRKNAKTFVRTRIRDRSADIVKWVKWRKKGRTAGGKVLKKIIIIFVGIFFAIIVRNF